MLAPPPDDILLAFRHALRRSRVRAEILLVLRAYGRQTLPDLARLVGATPDNVQGALYGSEKRYRPDESLLALGLVDVQEVDDVEAFELAALGQAVARRLHEEVERRRGPLPLVRT
ncbi:MAG TPA: archaellum operon transcriptional activator EarA family protein [Candidatus Thermoplasmatota archaeon]|nr:archaellum operon transcriptional activator EarA family protein [Candidatus Thermoplasmatota archaeon]